MAELDLRKAQDYNDHTTQAVRAVLIEIGQVLGSFQSKFVVVGGSVPWLLLNQSEDRHVGTMDVDLVLDPTALGDGEYANLVNLLLDRGYAQSKELRKFQLVRTVPIRGGTSNVKIIVDFLMPRNASVVKNNPPLINAFAVQKADAASLALEFSQALNFEGSMVDGGRNRVTINVASIPAFLAMKGYAIEKRDKPKDAYDIYYCVTNYTEGMDGLVKAIQPLLSEPIARKGFEYIGGKFRSFDDYGPSQVRYFLTGSDLGGAKTPDQLQQDAFGQVDTLMRRLGLRN